MLKDGTTGGRMGVRRQGKLLPVNLLATILVTIGAPLRLIPSPQPPHPFHGRL